MKTVTEIIGELNNQIVEHKHRRSALESFRDRILAANGMGGEFQVSSGQVSSEGAAAALISGSAECGARSAECGKTEKAPAKAKVNPVLPATFGRMMPAPEASATAEVPPSALPAPRSGPKPGQNEDPRKVAGARELPEPFTAVALGVALGIPGTGPNTLLARWERMGWVQRGQVRGEWRRTQAFGRKTES